MAPKTIFAVAIGESLNPPNLNPPIPINTDPPPAGVRPYIQGLITGLKNNGFAIGSGADYVISYQQCTDGELTKVFKGNPNPDVVFCMSIRVVKHAQPIYRATPIVGVVSDHTAYAGTNITGFSAKRFQSALDGYNNFLKTVQRLTAIYVLHHSGHDPSINALKSIQQAYPAGPYAPHVVPVKEGLNIIAELNRNNIPKTAGVFVLPVDRCFGEADDIISWQNQKQVPTFWPVTDWVNSGPSGALGGYGVPQDYCGQRMGAKVAFIWKNGGAIPPFEDCKQTDLQWIASRNTAGALQVTLGAPAGLTII
jgi:hypothetical protein